MFISKCHSKSSIGNPTQKPDITCTRGQMKWIPPKNKCMIYWIHNYCGYMHCKQYNTNHSLWSADSRAIIGRRTADIRCLSADGSLINCHRPTVWRSSADWRPMIGRHSADIMMKKSSKRRPIVGRSSGDHRPTLHRWQNPWKSADRSTKLLTWVLRQKSRRPTKKSSKIGADVGRRRPTIGRRRPIFPFLAHRPSVDRRFG